VYNSIQELKVITQPILGQILKQALRYCLVGGVAAITQLCSVIAIVECFGTNPLWANVIGFCFGFVVSLLGHRHWTFADSPRQMREVLPRFTLLALINFSINQPLFAALHQHSSRHYSSSLLMAILVAASITFLLNKFWIFKGSHS